MTSETLDKLEGIPPFVVTSNPMLISGFVHKDFSHKIELAKIAEKLNFLSENDEFTVEKITSDVRKVRDRSRVYFVYRMCLGPRAQFMSQGSTQEGDEPSGQIN